MVVVTLVCVCVFVSLCVFVCRREEGGRVWGPRGGAGGGWGGVGGGGSRGEPGARGVVTREMKKNFF